MIAEAPPGLIETMRLRRDGSIDRLALHLSRLESSARTLGIACATADINAALRSVSPTGQDQRLRLEMAADGQLQVTAFPLAEANPEKPWRLALAATRLDADDPLLRHKTTRRVRYVKARQEFPADGVDEVLLLNRQREVCEGTITNVFVQNGRDPVLKTPHLKCGLLRGVLRQQLLDEGRAVETVLTVEDLASAGHLYVGNSLRGLLPAVLSDQ